jgi:Initiator Replication protein
MAKLNKGLTLNQMRLLAYAIYSTQQDGKTKFIKADFESKFSLKEYRTEHASEDVKKLYELGFSTINLKEDEFDYLRVFQRITYKKGTFSFLWTDDMLPHILELKDKYVLTDLTITSQFRSGFSWILYEY